MRLYERYFGGSVGAPYVYVPDNEWCIVSRRTDREWGVYNQRWIRGRPSSITQLNHWHRQPLYEIYYFFTRYT